MDMDTIKYIELIQKNIERMNSNSFKLKGWMIIMVSGFIALAFNTYNEFLFLGAIVSILLFWLLDAYYLQQERKFRGLYDDVVNGHVEKIFSMDISKYKKRKYSYISAIISESNLLLYGLASIFSFLFIVVICC